MNSVNRNGQNTRSKSCAGEASTARTGFLTWIKKKLKKTSKYIDNRRKIVAKLLKIKLKMTITMTMTMMTVISLL